MDNKKIQIIIIGGALGVTLLFVLIFQGILPGLQKDENTGPQPEGTLAFWGVGDGASLYDPAIKSFKETYPKVKVEYRRFPTMESYEQELLEALAVGRGPDIFMIPNDGLTRNMEKIAMAPASSMSLLQLRSLFPGVVEEDFVRGGQVGALPLYIDTLALIYNKNLLNQAGIVFPPKTWNELAQMARKLTKYNERGGLIQAGVALGGTTDTVAHAADIFELLAMQEAAFEGKALTAGNILGEAGRRALDFYRSFGAPAEGAPPTWNELQPYSLDAFVAGRAAMAFAYAEDLKGLKTKNAFITATSAPIPQKANTPNSLTHASYWGYTVSRQSAQAELAWRFIIFMTTNPNIAEGVAGAKGVTPALNMLIQKHLQAPATHAFASQVLIARSVQKADERRAEEGLAQVLRAAIQGGEETGVALGKASGSYR